MITRYGYDVFFTVATLCLVLIVLAFLFIEPRGLRYVLAGFALVVFGLTANFFRDPERVSPSGDNLVIAPADGKIIQVRNVREPDYLGSDAVQISIFMSPLDVHVNRNPISGVVGYLRYTPGQYFAAFEDKASERNEQNAIGIQSGHMRVLFRPAGSL